MARRSKSTPHTPPPLQVVALVHKLPISGHVTSIGYIAQDRQLGKDITYSLAGNGDDSYRFTREQLLEMALTGKIILFKSSLELPFGQGIYMDGKGTIFTAPQGEKMFNRKNWQVILASAKSAKRR